MQEQHHPAPGVAAAPNMRVKTVTIAGLIAFALLTVLTAALTPAVQARFHPLPTDQGPAWYYWQVPNPSVLIRFSYWGGYVVHQLVVWGLFFAGRRSVTDPGRANRFHISMLVVNVAFVALHLAQTYFFYGGLAQDVPIWTSQGSVIVMLVLILYMMIPKRGLFFGRRFDPPQRLLRLINASHGFVVSWALVFTFWFHPMEGNWGMLSGFVYMFLLFIQRSLFNTSLHTDPRWIVLLEVFVAVHGTLVTLYKHNPIWPMFLFGFLLVFIITQLHIREFPRWFKVVASVATTAALVFVYSSIRGWNRVFEVSFIPVALYGGAVGLLLVGAIWDKIARSREPAVAGT